MMEFKQWLSENNIFFTSFLNDGTVVAVINGKRYTYITDRFHHSKWQRMKQYSPWKVLKQIEKFGKLIDVDGMPLQNLY